MVWIRFWQKTDPGYVPRTKRDFKNSIDFFCFHAFGVRCSIDVLDTEKQPGSGLSVSGVGAQGLLEEV